MSNAAADAAAESSAEPSAESQDEPPIMVMITIGRVSGNVRVDPGEVVDPLMLAHMFAMLAAQHVAEAGRQRESVGAELLKLRSEQGHQKVVVASAGALNRLKA